MNTRPLIDRRRASPPGLVRRAQGGTAARGAVVAAGIAAALVLQLAGPRMQCHLADLVGAPSAAPVMTPASTPSCGSPAGANPMHPCKVAEAAAGFAPLI